jgi:predicted DNA-binding transcriptional regulator YafY
MTLESTPESGHNERLAIRLAEILTRLNRGDVLDHKQLAEEFKISERTSYRDLHERLAFLVDKTNKGLYVLRNGYFGKLDYDDIRNFAALAGVTGMFPQLDQNFIRQLVDSRARIVYSSMGQSFEDANQFRKLFQGLEHAILNHHLVSFTYKNSPRTVQPYKLIQHRGRWYLAAVEHDKFKVYRIALMLHAKVESHLPAFKPNPDMIRQIEQEDSIWFSADREIEVIILIDAKIASYFQSKVLLPEQQLIRELENGNLLVSSKITHVLELLPLINYWIPHLRIISPESLQQELEENLKLYLNQPHSSKQP